MTDFSLGAERIGRRIDSGWIWRDLTLELRGGENLAVVGPTGSGKSLLLRCLASLDAVDEGTLLIEGKPYDEWSMPALRSRVVYLHQRPALWEGSVDDNLASVFRLAAHKHQRYDRERAVFWLRCFDRGESFLNKSTADLSGGEQQITALVRALSIDPSVVLLDEASASMDEGATAQFETVIGDWVAEVRGRAAVWTSHDARQIERVANRTLALPGQQS